MQNTCSLVEMSHDSRWFSFAHVYMPDLMPDDIPSMELDLECFVLQL